LILADTPEAFAGSVVRLLRDPEIARRVGQRAAARVRETFGWRQVAENFASICEQTVSKAAAHVSIGDDGVFVGQSNATK
jgi:glycosyltransferase involved in cell wall biosynthesis